MKVLVTGAAGFIGSNLVERLLTTESPIEIVGLDSVNDYYDVSIKEYRLRKLDALAEQYLESKWEFVKGNLADKALIDKLFESHKELVEMQPGDVPVTFAGTSALERDFGFKPHTALHDGLRKFTEWYKEFYG